MSTRVILPPTVTPSALRRAIYFDFEGCVGEPPALVGYLVDGQLRQVVLDARLRSAADAKELPVDDGRSVMRELVGRCRREGRVLVAFTSHERHTVSDHYGIVLDPWYVDAHKLAKRAFNRLPLAMRPAGWSLGEMLAHIGEPPPSYLGVQKSAARLRSVREMLARREHYRALTATVKGKWTRFLQHNECDVRGMALLAGLALDQGALEEASQCTEGAGPAVAA